MHNELKRPLEICKLALRLPQPIFRTSNTSVGKIIQKVETMFASNLRAFESSVDADYKRWSIILLNLSASYLT